METDIPIFILQMFHLLICNFDRKVFIASVWYGIKVPPPSSIFHAIPIFCIGLCVYFVVPPLFLFRRLLFLFRRFVLRFLIWCTIFIAIKSLSFPATRVVSNKHITLIRIRILILIRIVPKDIDPNTKWFVVCNLVMPGGYWAYDTGSMTCALHPCNAEDHCIACGTVPTSHYHSQARSWNISLPHHQNQLLQSDLRRASCPCIHPTNYQEPSYWDLLASRLIPHQWIWVLISQATWLSGSSISIAMPNIIPPKIT